MSLCLGSQVWVPAVQSLDKELQPAKIWQMGP
jgi:hypothetical protein